MRRLLLCACVLLLLPVRGFAAGSITRRDGFLSLWESIRRASSAVRETPFTDVPKGAKGEEEITYAKARGILDDDETFRPDAPLELADALLWFYRTRNVDDPDLLTPEHLPDLLRRYPLEGALQGDGSGATVTEKTLDEEGLLSLMRTLDGELAAEDHEVSLYSEKFNGKGTAFGETFDMNSLTAAHRTFPQNTLVRVTNVENGKSVVVRINDRGPYVAGRDMDLSLAAFTTIADRSKGKIRATFVRLGDSTLVGLCALDAVQTRIGNTVRLTSGLPQAVRLGTRIILRADRAFVVDGVTYPDGNRSSAQDWVLPGEQYALTPSMEGRYVFRLGTVEGRRRDMETTVVKCS